MKLSDIIIPFLFVSAGFCAEWDDPALGQADPEKPVYQSIIPGLYGLGGLYRKVRIPTAKDMQARLDYELKVREANEHMKRIRLANSIMLFGLMTAIGCMVFHACTSVKPLKRILEYIMTLGCTGVAGAILYKFLIRHEIAFEWIAGLLVFILFSLWLLNHPKVKDWSFTHGIKWLINKKPDTTHRG